ncbi:MAG: hypothetical protein JKY92_02055 [Magnetovibrio sp.]|nr:hypothetical protein [Magnetovibrio sp.]
MANKNHMSIPDVRARLKELAVEHGIEELSDLADQMYRRKLKAQRAPVTSQRMTLSLAAEIREYIDNSPTASNQQIADHFTVNPGRVSDALERD